MGKTLENYRRLKRIHRKTRGRRRYLRAFPWYDGSAHHVVVVDANNLQSNQKHIAEISQVGRGLNIGLMFELASKPIITEIICPVCKAVAPLNKHWQCFQCQGTDCNAFWEITGGHDGQCTKSPRIDTRSSG